LPYLNAKPRQIPLLVMQRMNSNIKRAYETFSVK